MSATGETSGELDGMLSLLGRQTVTSLAADHPGAAYRGTGWRGALQIAADRSDQDREILDIADDLYRIAPSIETENGARAYAEAALVFVGGVAAWSFLVGMLEQPTGPDHRAGHAP